MTELQPSREFYSLFETYIPFDNEISSRDDTLEYDIENIIIKELSSMIHINAKIRGKSYAIFPGVAYSDIRYIISELIVVNAEMYNTFFKHNGFDKINIYRQDITSFFARCFKQKFGSIKLPFNSEHVKYITKCCDYIRCCCLDISDNYIIISYLMDDIHFVYKNPINEYCGLCGKLNHKTYIFDNGMRSCVFCEQLYDFVKQYDM